MNDYFADSGYWIALITPGDEFHALAVEYDALLEVPNDRIITTQLALNEVLAPRSGSTAQTRRAAIELIDRITQDPRVSIVPAVLRSNLPKPLICSARWLMTRNGASPTAPVSAWLMRRLRIRNALTSDHHFRQAGFTVLLRQVRT